MSGAAERLIDSFLTGDTSGAVAQLADDVVFHSPVRDYAGAAQVAAVWQAVSRVLEQAARTST